MHVCMMFASGHLPSFAQPCDFLAEACCSCTQAGDADPQCAHPGPHSRAQVCFVSQRTLGVDGRVTGHAMPLVVGTSVVNNITWIVSLSYVKLAMQMAADASMAPTRAAGTDGTGVGPLSMPVRPRNEHGATGPLFDHHRTLMPPVPISPPAQPPSSSGGPLAQVQGEWRPCDTRTLPPFGASFPCF